MTPHCSEPDLQMAVLDDVRSAEALAPDCAQHLEECAACQTAVERMRRAVSAWTADQVDEQAIAIAAARFRSHSPPYRTAPGWLDVVPFAATGVAAGYLLLAVTGTIAVPWKSRPATDGLLQTAPRTSTAAVASSATESSPRLEPVFAATDEGAKWARARPHVETARGVAPLVDGLRLELKRGESARIALAGGQSSQLEGPCLVEFWSTPMEVGGWRIVRGEIPAPAGTDVEKPTGANGTSPPLAPSAPSAPVEHGAAARAVAEGLPANKNNAPGAREGASSARESSAAAALSETVASNAQESGSGANLVSARAWARAAVALREDDFETADRAFDELGHSLDPATRDAARLARAQLWISRGRSAAVRPVLEQLAQSGATALVRQRAAEFLARDAH